VKDNVLHPVFCLDKPRRCDLS